MSEQIITILIFVILAIFLFICIEGAIYLITRYQYKKLDRVVLNRNAFLRKTKSNNEGWELYNKKKLIDKDVLSFTFSSGKFYLLSETAMYIICRRTNSFVLVDSFSSSENDKRIFIQLRYDTLENVTQKENYYRILHENLQKSCEPN